MTETRVALSRERKLEWPSKPGSLALLHKESFAQTKWGRTEATQSTI